MSSTNETWITRCTFALISFIAFFGNALVLGVFFRNRSKINKKPFDIFIINLAATDLFTAIVLVFSRFLYLPAMPSTQPEAFMFCHLLWGGYILFGLGYISVYTCLTLTIERWIAVVKPHFYRRLNSNHALFCVIIVWIWGIFINSTVFISVGENFEEGKCEWIKPKTTNSVLPILEISVACLFPSLGIIVLYLHMFYRIHRSPLFLQGHGSAAKKRLVIIALVASVALIIGWLPTKISYILRFTSVGERHYDKTFHLIFVMMSLSNSCYGIFSSRLRKEYKATLRQLTFCRKCFVK